MHKILVTMFVALWASALSAQTHYSFDFRQYQNSMTVYFMLMNGENAVVNLDNYEVAAFIGNECRGIGIFEKRTGSNGMELIYGFMKVFSNEDGDEVSFKCYDKLSMSEKELSQTTIPFETDGLVGYPSSPKELRMKFTVTAKTSDEKLGTVEGGAIYVSGSSATVTATPKEGYHFSRWSDGSTVNTYHFRVNADSLLTAEFAPNKYKVTFMADGEVLTSNDLDYASIIDVPDAPDNNGFVFKGWYPAVLYNVPAYDVTFTAQYDRNFYFSSFVVDGELKAKTEVQFEGTIERPADPVKEGYTFIGWLPEIPEKMPAKDMSFTAQWERAKYKVTWIVDNENVEADVAYEEKISKPVDPVKEGYTFIGWSPEVPEIMPANSQTFTAQFQINQYTMTFVLDNGQDNVVKSQDFGSNLVAPTGLTKSGFTFNGWDEDVPATVPAENKTYTAQWERNSYKLTWDVDGTKTESTVPFETSITQPTAPTKEGYTFAGWTPAVAEKMPAADVTYTATWTINKYTMTFVLDNGAANVVKMQDYATGLTAPANPTKTGYTFKGWSPSVPATVPAENKTFTAQWEVNTYAVIYMVNGVEWARDSVEYGKTIVKKEYTPAAGETFNGWESDQEYTKMPAHDVTYTASITNAINTLSKQSGRVNVYTTNGVLVARGLNINQLRQQLAKGVYIIEGKIVVIK